MVEAGFGELYPDDILSTVYRTLEYLSGISDDDVRRLRAVGIKHTNQLLHRATLDIDRRKLEKKTGITRERLFEFVNQCTLLEVSGLEGWMRLVPRLGSDSMKARAGRGQAARAAAGGDRPRGRADSK